MKAPTWVLHETVLAFHEQLLAEFGGPSIFDLSESYCFGLVKNHPFVDGNKRIGFAVAVLFLEINGYRFCAPEADAAVRVLAAGELDEAGLSAWLSANARKA